MSTPHDPQQFGQGQNWGHQHGDLPPAPPPREGEGQAPQRPASVDTSFMLWLVAAAIGVISSLLSFGTQDELAAEMGVAADTGANAAGTVVGLIVIGIWIAVVFAMRNGKNWARIVLAVLGGLNVVFGLFGLLALGILFSLGITGALQGLLSIASLAAVVAAIVFMFKPDANYYFKHA
jgi:hypothetical protein